MTDEQLRSKCNALQEQWLPFDFVEEEKQKEAEDKARREDISTLPHFEHPQTDNERLLEFQYKYRHGRQEALSEMYELCETIGMKFINAIGRKNRHVKSLSYEQRQIKAADAASYITEQFITRPDFRLKNGPGYLFLRIEKELFYQRKVDKIVDFVNFDTFFKEGSADNLEE